METGKRSERDVVAVIRGGRWLSEIFRYGEATGGMPKTDFEKTLSAAGLGQRDQAAEKAKAA